MQQAAPPQFHPLWGSVPTLIWAGLLLVAIIVFRHELQGLLSVLNRRLRLGAGVKFGGFEIGQVYVAPGGGVADGGSIQGTHTDDGTRHLERQRYYLPNRSVLLVHRIAPSARPGMLYDVLIYLVAHPKSDASLIGVSHVEYYFGKSWGRQVFTSIDRARGFAIATSAYGPFMCTAKIHFNDSTSVIVSRYIDFEMGGVGAAPEPPHPKNTHENET